jgi:hypothetical protein
VILEIGDAESLDPDEIILEETDGHARDSIGFHLPLSEGPESLDRFGVWTTLARGRDDCRYQCENQAGEGPRVSGFHRPSDAADAPWRPDPW